MSYLINLAKKVEWEKWLQSVMDKANWSRGKALREMMKARKELGISYKDYARNNFFEMTEEQQKAEAEKILKKRAKKEERLQSVMDKTGWSREKTIQEMTKVRKELGVSYKDYERNNFFEMTEEQQKVEAEKILAKKKEWKECVAFVVKETGQDRKTVVEALKKAREEYYISAKQFVDKHLYEVPLGEYATVCENIRDRNARVLRRRFIANSIKRSKENPPQKMQIVDHDISHLKYISNTGGKQPAPVIAACYYLGVPLPEDASGEYQPSAYVPELTGGLETIRGIIGKRRLPDSELINSEYSSFKSLFQSRSNLTYNETDLIIFFTDFVMHCMDHGYCAVDYFNYEFYKKEIDVRKQFVSIGRYKRFMRRVCIKQLDLFKNKGSFNRNFRDFIKRDWLDMTMTDIGEFRSFVDKHDIFFAKPILGTGGYGARKIGCAGKDIKELYETCVKKKYIIEELVMQHKEMSAFNSDTLNTIRVWALTDVDNKPHIIGAVARFGRVGNDVDNFHSGGVGAAVDPETGTIYTDAIDINGGTYTEHPDSHIGFKGFVVPEWEKVKTRVAEACLHCVDINRHVGWDIAITDKGEIEFIEANATPNFDLLQAADQIGKFDIYDRYMTPLAEAVGIKPVHQGQPTLDVSHMQMVGNPT